MVRVAISWALSFGPVLEGFWFAKRTFTFKFFLWSIFHLDRFSVPLIFAGPLGFIRVLIIVNG